MALWEQVLVGALAVGVVFFFMPGIKASLKQSREAKSKDWAGALFPIGLVVLFVIVLIAIARG